MDFAIPLGHRVKFKENEKKDKYLDLARELKKTVDNEGSVYTNCYWCSWYSHRRIIKGTGGFGNKRTSGDYPNYYSIEIGQITEKNPGDFRRLAVAQTLLIEHQR